MRESSRHSSLPTVERDVLVPAGHAILGGGFGAITIALLVACAAVLDSWRWWIPPLIGATGGAIIAAIIAGWLIIDRRKLLNDIEKLMRIDVNRDGKIGDIRIVPVRGAWEAAQHKARQDATTFHEFLREIYTGRPTTWREWENELSQEQWEKYCLWLLDANLAERKGTTSPLVLTSTFREALVAFAEIL